MIVPMLREHTL